MDHFYTLFAFKEDGVLVETRKGISYYYLDSKYAESNRESSEIKYIKDSDNHPFTDDVIKILSVYDLRGNEYPINDITNPRSVFLREYNCIQIPNGVEGILSIQYQAKHSRIPLNVAYDSEIEINIPAPYLSALQAYVACIFLQNMGGNKLNDSNAFYARYKTLVADLLNEGVGSQDNTGVNIRPQLGGWI